MGGNAEGRDGNRVEGGELTAHGAELLMGKEQRWAGH